MDTTRGRREKGKKGEGVFVQMMPGPTIDRTIQAGPEAKRRLAWFVVRFAKVRGAGGGGMNVPRRSTGCRSTQIQATLRRRCHSRSVETHREGKNKRVMFSGGPAKAPGRREKNSGVGYSHGSLPTSRGGVFAERTIRNLALRPSTYVMYRSPQKSLSSSRQRLVGDRVTCPFFSLRNERCVGCGTTRQNAPHSNV